MINLRNIFVKTNIVLVFCLIWNHSSLAQSLFDTTYIDTIALKVKRDFDAQDFIRMTKEDTSFHRAFKNLKMYPHQSKNSVTIFNKTWDQIAQLKRTATHLSDGKLGSIQIDNETTDGKFYKKNGEHKYFTGEMFDKVFFEKGKFDVDNAVKTNYSQQKPDDRTKKEKYAQIVSGKYQPKPYTTTYVETVGYRYDKVTDTDQVVIERTPVFSNPECPFDDSIPTPTSSSDVPGPIINLYKDNNIPLYNFANSINNNVYAITDDINTDMWKLNFITENTFAFEAAFSITTGRRPT